MAGGGGDQQPRSLRRGNYNCGRCGLPKRGHVCLAPSNSSGAGEDAVAGGGGGGTPPPPRLRRALSFDSPTPSRASCAESEEMEDDLSVEVGDGVFVPGACLVEVFARLPPRGVASAAAVSRGWRQCARRVWKNAEELRLRVPPPRGPDDRGVLSGLIGRCTMLARLCLRMESNFDATMLAFVAFSCPNLEVFEIRVVDGVVTQLTGDELAHFVSEKRYLSTLKIEGCGSLGLLNLSSSSLITLWLSDLQCISKLAINCPNLKELSLNFSQANNDSLDLVPVIESFGRTCPMLHNLHISSAQLCNESVLALERANLRGLLMLALVLGLRITDAALPAIARGYEHLELLDLSGSSISDHGIGMICKAFPHTLTRFLIALCPNITSSGVQFATSQLPNLELIDCGMSLCAVDSEDDIAVGEDAGEPKLQQQPTCQKLIIKHEHLKKISLWGCSGLDALFLNCPELLDLNLNSCKNLHPERLLLQCPNLENVYASGCQDVLIGAIKNQVLNEILLDSLLPCKRLADGSKRIHAPILPSYQPNMEDKQVKRRRPQCRTHLY